MKKEDLIIKWLDNNLDEKELKAFKQLDASSVFVKIDETAQRFKAPAFDADAAYRRLKAEMTPARGKHWKRYLAGIAAALVISLSSYYAFFSSTETTFLAENTQKIEFKLPDTSEVILNAGSSVTYSKKNWQDDRNLSLNGEAYFKVAKGSKFTVITGHGNVSVLGTQFTVKSRDNFFEVICYEGMVQVNYNGTNINVPAGNSFNAFGNETGNGATPLLEPSWLYAKSSFTSVPYVEVVRELERQYNVNITLDSGINQTLFTGSFTHNNLDTALQAITIPLNLSYTIKGNKVVLKSN